MRKKDVCVIGHFGGNKKFNDGQTVKTLTIYNALLSALGSENINKIDTFAWRKNPLKLFLKSIIYGYKSKNIIVLPAHKGVRVFIPLYVLLRKVLRYKLHYIVIGGWLVEEIRVNKSLVKYLKSVDSIYVETNKLLCEMKLMGIKNIKFFPNFKDIKKLEESDLILSHVRPYKICTFSRVMKEKGISDLIDVINDINRKCNRVVYELDIYGPINTNYEEEFERRIKKSDSISYCGVVEFKESVKYLKKYYLLIFPTKFKTEGIPGTIIDSYCAGVPVISSEWDSCRDIIIDKKTGIIYKFNSCDSLYDALKYASENYDQIIKMKVNCLEYSKKFSSDEIMKVLFENLKYD